MTTARTGASPSPASCMLDLFPAKTPRRKEGRLFQGVGGAARTGRSRTACARFTVHPEVVGGIWTCGGDRTGPAGREHGVAAGDGRAPGVEPTRRLRDHPQLRVAPCADRGSIPSSRAGRREARDPQAGCVPTREGSGRATAAWARLASSRVTPASICDEPGGFPAWSRWSRSEATTPPGTHANVAPRIPAGMPAPGGGTGLAPLPGAEGGGDR